MPAAENRKSGSIGADESEPQATKNHKWYAGGRIDWAVGARTHRIALGSTVHVAYGPPGDRRGRGRVHQRRLGEPIRLADVAGAAGYSERHAGG